VLNSGEPGRASCPDSIAVIGGGRWACVLAEKLCKIVPGPVRLSVHSRHNSESVAAWMAAHALRERIHVSSEWPRSCEDTSAVIVANAARDHEKAVEWALGAGLPVLVEKPIALNAASAQHLVDQARTRTVRLAAANVFLFASYLERFAALVSDERDIRFVRVCWMDPGVENRYGAEKRFDPGLPIFADWLPHVSSILGTLLPSSSHRCERLRFVRGGAHLELELAVGGVPCSVQLVRNGERRQRVIEVAVSDRVLQLDFSVEPGRIGCGPTTLDGDPDWNVRESPLGLMLRAFLRWAAGGWFDRRLDTEIGLRACRLVDQTLPMYHAALLPWLTSRLTHPGNADEDLRYALGEILQFRGLLSTAALEREIERVRDQFAKAPDTKWLSALISARAASAEEQS
jgi:predicted dehydrogenase